MEEPIRTTQSVELGLPSPSQASDYPNGCASRHCSMQNRKRDILQSIDGHSTTAEEPPMYTVKLSSESSFADLY